MNLAHRIATLLGVQKSEVKSDFADIAQKISLDSRLAHVAECLERELFGQRETSAVPENRQRFLKASSA